MALEIRSSDSDHLQWLKRYSPDFWKQKKILDVGCGSGYLCQYALEAGAAFACGLDLIRPGGYSNRQSWVFEQTDLDAPAWSGALKSYDSDGFHVILALDIIEHLISPFRFLENCSDILLPGGLLVITTPNLNSWERLLKPENWSGCIDPQHKTLFNIYSLKFLLGRVNFVVEHCEAPVRSLGFLNGVLPPVGGQIFSVFRKDRRKKHISQM